MKSPCSGRDADIFVGGGTTKDPRLVVRPKLRILRRLRMTVTREDLESIYRPGKTGLPSTAIWRMNCSLRAVIASGTVAYARSLLNRWPSCVAHHNMRVSAIALA